MTTRPRTHLLDLACLLSALSLGCPSPAEPGQANTATDSGQPSDGGSRQVDAGSGFDPLVLRNGLVRYDFSNAGQLLRMVAGASAYENEAAFLWRLSFVDDAGVTTPITAPGDPEISADATGTQRILRWSHLSVSDPNDTTVVVTVTLPPSATRAIWAISIDNRSAQILSLVEYPFIKSHVGESAADDYVLVPCWGGAVVAVRDLQISDTDRFFYPGNLSIQMTALLDGSNNGIYLAARDSNGTIKNFGYEPVSTSLSLWARLFPVGLNEAGNDYESFELEMGPLQGDWYDAARAYRTWAIEQKWSPLRLQQQASLAPWVLRTRFFEAPINTASGFDPAINTMLSSYQAALDLTRDGEIVSSPFLWNAGPYAEGEYLPVRGGFGAETAKSRDAGVPVLPYTNARVAHLSLPTFTAEMHVAAAKRADGSLYIERYGGSDTAVLCPATSFMQQRHASLVSSILSSAPIAGIHLDQIGGANAVLCFDARHGHPIGGGSFWANGIHALASAAHQAGRLSSADFSTTTEDPLELLNDVVEFHTNHYVLGAVVRLELTHSQPVPLLTAIYHDRTSYILSNTTVPATMSQLAYDVTHAYGYVIGNHLSAIDVPSASPFSPLAPIELSFLRTLIDSYGVSAPYALRGEMMRPPIIAGADLVGVDYPNPYDATVTEHLEVPRVFGSLWRASDGSVGLVLLNPTTSGQTVSVTMNKRQHDLPSGEVTATSRFPGDATLVGSFSGDISLTRSVPARSVSVISLTH